MTRVQWVISTVPTVNITNTCISCTAINKYFVWYNSLCNFTLSLLVAVRSNCTTVATASKQKHIQNKKTTQYYTCYVIQLQFVWGKRSIPHCQALQQGQYRVSVHIDLYHNIFFFLWRCGPTLAMASSFLRFLDHTHNDAPQSVEFSWTRDQCVAETPTWQHTTLTTDIHAPGGIRTHNLRRRAAVELRLRPHGHWDRHHNKYIYIYEMWMCLIFKFEGINVIQQT